MKPDTLDLHFLGSFREQSKTLKKLFRKLDQFEKDLSDSKTLFLNLNNLIKKSTIETNEKNEQFEEAVYVSKMCQQRLDAIWGVCLNRLLEQDGKLLDQDDKFSAMNQRIVQQENSLQEHSKMVDSILEIVDGDIKREEVLGERLKKIEFDLERTYELIAQQSIDLNLLKTKPSMVSMPLEIPEKTFEKGVLQETLQTENFEKPMPKNISSGKENKPTKPPIKSEYSQFFSDKPKVQTVSVNLFEDVSGKKEGKDESKKTTKHVKTKSMPDFVTDTTKKKK